MNRQVTIDYTNYRGERGVRVIEPGSIRHGATEFHPQPQWLLTAWDVAKQAERVFALRDIHSWSDGDVKAQVEAEVQRLSAGADDTWQRAVQCAVSHLDYESGAPERVKGALRILRNEFLAAGGYAAGAAAATVPGASR